MTTRRSFLGSILAAATPPGFVRAGVLMPVAPLIALDSDEVILCKLEELAKYLDDIDAADPEWRRYSIEWHNDETPVIQMIEPTNLVWRRA